MKLALAALPCLIGLAGCTVPVRDIGHAPDMSPVGRGLQSDVAGLTAYGFPAAPRSSPQSLWADDRANLFKDPRATRVGDVLTVTMDMDEKATLGNNTDLKNEATVSNGFDLNTGMGSDSFKISPKLNLDSATESKGTTSTDRSDKVRVSVAAVVTGVLPDGNMLIRGTQAYHRGSGGGAPARHLEGEYDSLYQDRRGPNLLWRARANDRNAAAELGTSDLQRH